MGQFSGQSWQSSNQKTNYGHKKYIIGVALPRFELKKDVFSSFVRISYGFPYIQKMIKDLQSHEDVFSGNVSTAYF